MWPQILRHWRIEILKAYIKKAAEKEITNLIGYSAGNPYDIPLDADLINDTSKGVELEECKKIN